MRTVRASCSRAVDFFSTPVDVCVLDRGYMVWGGEECAEVGSGECRGEWEGAWGAEMRDGQETMPTT